MSEKYLRNRPFLAINLIQKPRKGVKTEVAGWNKTDGNWDVLENPVVITRVNDKHMIECNIIIDLLNQKIVKNGFPENSDEDVLAHYLGKYSSQIAETLQEWNNLHPKAEVKAEPTVVTYTAV